MTDLFFSVDIESSGAAPPVHTLLSIGCSAFFESEEFKEESNFYVELKPRDGTVADPEAMAINGMDFEKLKLTGIYWADAMRAMKTWADNLASSREATPILVAAPAVFDGTWIYVYSCELFGKGIFGHNGVDVRSYWMALTGDKYRFPLHKVKKQLGVDLPHTHNSLDDAREQAVLFHAMLKHASGIRHLANNLYA